MYQGCTYPHSSGFADHPTKIVQMFILEDLMSEMKEIEVVKLAERKNLTYFFQNIFLGCGITYKILTALIP